MYVCNENLGLWAFLLLSVKLSLAPWLLFLLFPLFPLFPVFSLFPYLTSSLPAFPPFSAFLAFPLKALQRLEVPPGTLRNLLEQSRTLKPCEGLMSQTESPFESPSNPLEPSRAF